MERSRYRLISALGVEGISTGVTKDFQRNSNIFEEKIAETLVLIGVSACL